MVRNREMNTYTFIVGTKSTTSPKRSLSLPLRNNLEKPNHFVIYQRPNCASTNEAEAYFVVIILAYAPNDHADTANRDLFCLYLIRKYRESQRNNLTR